MKRISISGPPASGKTTLWNDLRSDLKVEAKFLEDLPRSALETLDPALEAWNDEAFQHFVGFHQLLEEQPSDDPLVICDKSLLDAVSYWDVLFDGTRPAWASKLETERYEVVFICDHLAIEPEQETLHMLHVGFRDALRNRIEHLAQAAARRVVVLSGNRERRVSRVLAELE